MTMTPKTYTIHEILQAGLLELQGLDSDRFEQVWGHILQGNVTRVTKDLQFTYEPYEEDLIDYHQKLDEAIIADGETPEKYCLGIVGSDSQPDRALFPW